MIKSVLSILALHIALVCNAQDASVFVTAETNVNYVGPVAPNDFSTHDFAGEQLDYYPAAQGEITVQFNFLNNSGSTKDWIVSRRRINGQSGWNDFMIVAAQNDPFGNAVMPYTADSTIWIVSLMPLSTLDTEYLTIRAHITPSFNSSYCSIYRYYVGTELDPFQDSVDFNICQTVGIDELNSTELSVYPNPASDIIDIEADVANGSMQMIDLLGNIVMMAQFDQTLRLSMGEIKSGVYFIILESEGNSPIKKKIIIQH